MTTPYWLTNCPEAAEALRKADADYAAARKAGEGLMLADKIVAYREAKEARDEAYRLVRAGPDDRPLYATSWPEDIGL